MSKICKHCGATVDDEAIFCTECGEKLEEENTDRKCPHCGAPIQEGANFCAKCGKTIAENQEATIAKEASNSDKEKEETDISAEKSNEQIEKSNGEVDKPVNKKSDSNKVQRTNNHKGYLGLFVLLLIIAIGVGAFFYYKNIYLPDKIDREAPRYYTLANAVVLRSSKSSGADFNKIGTLPYGTELITYEHDAAWSHVKVNSANVYKEKQKGYVASAYILNKPDFFLLNSIFGDADSKMTVATAKCRIALLNYFKDNGYIGNISIDILQEIGLNIVPNENNQWQVFSKPARLKPNNVLFKRLINKNSKFTDFAVIIKNIKTGKRKLLYFYFDDDETPHLATEQEAPNEGFIRDAYIQTDYQGRKYLQVVYSE